ncbi:MAG TPA: phosphatidylserine decarboxylase [Vicinamibacterales bacterium]|jgi:phosphatidylserine decarboxylase|nr:phosphatidylserine decarboxylase [Vicinamibacterales bacterium]
MRLDPAGLPFIAGALLLALVSGALVAWVLAIPFVLLGAFFAFFFRDPERIAPSDPHAVLAPADGRVIIAGPAVPGAAPPGEWMQVSIFLSPVDVHVNRIPVSGHVTRVSSIPGRFLPAYRHDAGNTNERSEIWIDHAGQNVVARQVVGILARRVVCRVKSGADVQAGDRFGIMKFGSRMDVFLPPTAAITVKVGDFARGGETVIAVLHSHPISHG